MAKAPPAMPSITAVDGSGMMMGPADAAANALDAVRQHGSTTRVMPQVMDLENRPNMTTSFVEETLAVPDSPY
jgi:hypothetical protein